MSRGTILVTGAGGALGRAIAAQAAARPSTYGIFTLRDSSSPTSTIALSAALRAATPGPGPGGEGSDSSHAYELASLDLSNLASVRTFATDINRRVASGELPPIRALVLNAGYQEHFTLTKTADGFDMTFQVCYLGHFLLTQLLLPSLDRLNGRILTIGSWMHDPSDPHIASGIFTERFRTLLGAGVEAVARGQWSTPETDPSASSGLRRYGAAKLCQVSFIGVPVRLELQRRLNSSPSFNKICSSALDPGAMPSTLMKRGSWFQGYIINQWGGWAFAPLLTWWSPNGFLRTPTKSASDAIAILYEKESPGGVYFNGSDVHTPSEEARDEAVATKLWEESINLAGMTPREANL
ncbi:hypothetical protein Micbo1qcDRAFT_230323 [Microdochium bolleyi]|uniref:Short-chain dehydrogenase n=1 Tax=Microdochium bolleyi TaxID=196109 RepID=A0A136JCP2_9PEZI|nr:hypothetical protein Micbo1qcDRAFT_230323 [Microdochium bolleyi]